MEKMKQTNKGNQLLKIIGIILALIISVMPMTIVGLSTGSNLFSTVVGVGLIVAICAGMGYIAYRQQLFTLGRRETALGSVQPLGKAVGLGILAAVLMRIYVVVIAVAAGMMNGTANDQGIQAVQESAPVMLMFIVMTIVAPFVEEIIFRGMIFNYFFTEHKWLGLLVSSLFFTAIHMPTDLVSFLIYFGEALLLGGVYLWTKRLEISMLAHSLNNLLPAVIMLFM